MRLSSAHSLDDRLAGRWRARQCQPADGANQVTLTPKYAIPTAVEANNIVNRIEKPLTDAGLESAADGSLGAVAVDPNAAYLSFAIGIAAALIVLLLTFGSAVTMLLPIITAIFGVVIGTMVITLLSHISSVPSSVGALGGMIGLGVGIDYSLFVLSRHREQLADGMEITESIGRSVATSGAAVLFAGTTVVIALCSLAIAGIPIVAQLGYLSAIFVVTAILSALTLLPAVLGLLGKRYDALRLPGYTGAGRPRSTTTKAAGRVGREESHATHGRR